MNFYKKVILTMVMVVITHKLPLEVYSENMQMIDDSIETPMKVFKFSCLKSLIFGNKRYH